ncbi:hypothetical protein OIDMADRAFT_48849 [Oidiodendron maius Zn]|uniref:ABM domain-containing protein n=1 Tax=Oidiodendron maius (strain Zn) TaxID=913774 RepID=A0A0C3E3R4_OIDMZ|nr:hypothetical protein OIDMADRAFT_48849 [Oidiodendron maius Zn]
MSANLIVKEFLGAFTPFESQLEGEAGPITFINTFVLPSTEAVEPFLAHWNDDGAYMKSQYGMLSAQLHRSLGHGSNVFVNVAIWESLDAFRRAFQNPDFQRTFSEFPKGTHMYPLVLTKVAVPGVCVN